jgi:predicted RNase H-like HicB family nuclease
MEFTVLIHTEAEGGFWAEVPALSGCFSQGETVDDTLSNVKEAIEGHICALREDGQSVNGDNGLLITSVQIAA